MNIFYVAIYFLNKFSLKRATKKSINVAEEVVKRSTRFKGYKAF